MKNFIAVLLVLITVSASAAITGPFPIGPGAAPLPAAVARVSRIDVCLFPAQYVIVNVEQYVSADALVANVMAGQTSFDMTQAEFKTYVLDPIAAGTIHTYEAGVEDWLIAKKLPGWTKIQ